MHKIVKKIVSYEAKSITIKVASLLTGIAGIDLWYKLANTSSVSKRLRIDSHSSSLTPHALWDMTTPLHKIKILFQNEKLISNLDVPF